MRFSAMVPFLVVALSACATETPSELSLTPGETRVLVTEVGESVDEMKRACADTMIAASPADRATQVAPRVVSEGERTVIEVDAVLMSVGFWKENFPITYRCEYQDQKLMKGVWTRGLKGE